MTIYVLTEVVDREIGNDVYLTKAEAQNALFSIFKEIARAEEDDEYFIEHAEEIFESVRKGERYCGDNSCLDAYGGYYYRSYGEVVDWLIDSFNI